MVSIRAEEEQYIHGKYKNSYNQRNVIKLEIHIISRGNSYSDIRPIELEQTHECTDIAVSWTGINDDVKLAS